MLVIVKLAELVAFGIKVYRLPAVAEGGGVPEIVSTELAAEQ